MKIDLKGKRALVTGSTSGMGYAIAKGLAESGATVIIHGRDHNRVALARTRLLRELPLADLSGHAADLADAGAVRGLLAAVPDVDILVNSAGPTEGKPFFDLTDEEWQEYLNIYVIAAVRLSRQYVRQMMDRGWGRVMFSAAVVSGFMPRQGDIMTHWGTCKAALLGLSRGLAECTAGTGVTVNAFIPGPAHTEESYMSRARPVQDKTFAQIEREYFDGPLSSSLLGRFAHPDEIAAFVVFLASQQASAITGASLHVDGGIIRSI
jgi:NAD(P)-dependent dehydrogenase (short-subunit alcohol dehydrogenase family)